MNNEEYIIINKSKLLERIEEIESNQKNIIKELKDLYNKLNNTTEYYDLKDNISRCFTTLTNEKRVLKEILSNSTPLISEIEKVYRTAFLSDDIKLFQDYITNLKLNI